VDVHEEIRNAVHGKPTKEPSTWFERETSGFYCRSCGSEFETLRQRNGHDMAAYVAAQQKKKDIAARKAQSKKKKKS
jgi:hypothetical protein